MKDFDKLRTRLRQFGGWRLVWQYARMGVLWTGVKALASCAVSGRSLKSAYPAITKRGGRDSCKEIQPYLGGE